MVTPSGVANAIINKINSLISSHNSDGYAHQDIRTSLNDKVSSSSLSTVATTGDYDDLNNKPTIPTATSDLTNDSFGEMAYHSYLSEIAGSTDIIDILQADGYSLFSGDYDDLDNKPSIPSNTSDLNNNSGFITSSSVPIASSTVPSADTTSGSVGTGTAWARSDHTHPKSSLYADADTLGEIDYAYGLTGGPIFGVEGVYDYDLTLWSKLFYDVNNDRLYYNKRGDIYDEIATLRDIPSITGKEDNANKVTSLSSSSTDTQYPSAKCVYDAIENTFNLDTLDCINENFTLLSLPQPIIFTYNADSINGTQAELFASRLLTRYTKGAYVDWGDGTPIETYEGNILEHVYSDNVQEHTIIIYGEINQGYLGNSGFQDLTGLTSINIPSTVIKIGHNSFYGCTGLTSINLPKELANIGLNVFQGCINLNTIILNWTDSVPIDYTRLMYGSPSTISPTFSIPYGTTSLYESKGYPTEKLVERSE